MSELFKLYQTYLESDKKNFAFITTLSELSDPITLNKRDHNNETILHYAVKKQDIETVRLLLAKGIDVNAINNNKHTAIWYCLDQPILNIPLVGLLVIHGADIDEMDMHCHSALFLAVIKGETKKVKQLLGLGANVNQTDLKLVTPLKLILISLIKELNLQLVIKDRNSLANILTDKSPVISQDFTDLEIPEALFENVIVIGSTKFISRPEEYYSVEESTAVTPTHEDNPSIASTLQAPAAKEFDRQQAINSQNRNNHYVHRMMKGFKKAITNVEEFEEAIQKGVKFDFKAIEIATANSSDEQVKALHAKVKELIASESVANIYIHKKSTEINLQKYIARFLARHSLFPTPKDSMLFTSEATEKFQGSHKHADLQELIESEEMIIIREEKEKHAEYMKNIQGHKKA